MEQENRRTNILENGKSSTQLNRGKILIFFSMLTIVFIFIYTRSRSKISSSHDDMERRDRRRKILSVMENFPKSTFCAEFQKENEKIIIMNEVKNNINFSLEKQFFFTLIDFFFFFSNKHNKKWKEFNFFFLDQTFCIKFFHLNEFLAQFFMENLLSGFDLDCLFVC